MKRQITEKILDTIKRYSMKHGDQVNLASVSAQQSLAELIVREVWDSNITLETYNEDQLELFSFMDTSEHK